MTEDITIDYGVKPLKRRRTVTRKVVAAINKINATPYSEDGQLASFALPAKMRSTVRTASQDCGVEVTTVLEAEDRIRVFLKEYPEPPEGTVADL